MRLQRKVSVFRKREFLGYYWDLLISDFTQWDLSILFNLYVSVLSFFLTCTILKMHYSLYLDIIGDIFGNMCWKTSKLQLVLVIFFPPKMYLSIVVKSLESQKSDLSGLNTLFWVSLWAYYFAFLFQSPTPHMMGIIIASIS